MKKSILLISVLLLIKSGFALEPGLKNLSRSSEEIKNLRAEIRTTIATVKSNRDEKQIPELKFYKYRVKKDDNLWNIIARTTLNIDTLMTVNQLENPSDLAVGSTIFIPNMRGIVHKVNKNETINDIGLKYKVNPRYIKHVNKINKLDKEFIFIPCGNLSREERSAFLSPGFRKPLDKTRITSAYGNRIDPFLRIPSFHSGVDFKCSTGTPVKASKSGKITFCGSNGNYGKLVIIKHTNGYETYYGHLSKFKVKIGDTVTAGQIIALSGNSGRSTGPHLHFEVRKGGSVINPMTVLR